MLSLQSELNRFPINVKQTPVAGEKKGIYRSVVQNPQSQIPIPVIATEIIQSSDMNMNSILTANEERTRPLLYSPVLPDPLFDKSRRRKIKYLSASTSTASTGKTTVSRTKGMDQDEATLQTHKKVRSMCS